MDAADHGHGCVAAVRISMPQDRRSESLNLQTYHALRNALLGGQLPPGARVNIELVARELHVSTSPVRHALNRLQREGFVTATPNRGFTTTWLIDQDNVLNVYTYRQIVEPAAAALAARRAPSSHSKELLEVCERSLDDRRRSPRGAPEPLRRNRSFHRTVAAATGNPLVVRYLSDALASIHVGPVHLERTAWEQSWEEHREIAFAVRDGDAEAAAAYMRAHLQNGLDRIKFCAEKRPDEHE